VIKLSFRKISQLVEIQTKLASIIPFLLGTVYVIYRYNKFNILNFFIMFISLLAFDMATTAINNYIDNKKSSQTLLFKYGINESTVLFTIFLLITIAIVFGVLLTINTNIIVLIIGTISFSVGILYTFGPVPISRMPLGELFSGLFMGFIIIFLSIYIHIYDTSIITFVYTKNILSLSINIIEIIYIFLFSLPAIIGIANIMFANNICDVEEDITNDRFTLPYYLGKVMSHRLFKLSYYIGYADIFILVILKVIPLASLLILLTYILVNKNITLFAQRPMKSETFILSVKNFVLMNGLQIIIMGISASIPKINA